MAIPILGDVDLNFGELIKAVLWSNSPMDMLSSYGDKQGAIFRNPEDTLPWYYGIADDQVVGFCKGVARGNVNMTATANGDAQVLRAVYETYACNPKMQYTNGSIANGYEVNTVNAVIRENTFLKFALTGVDGSAEYKIRMRLNRHLYDENSTLVNVALLDEIILFQVPSQQNENTVFYDYSGYTGVLHGDIMTNIPATYKTMIFVAIEGLPRNGVLTFTGYHEIQEVNLWLSP